MTNEEKSALINEILDLHINPLAQVITQTLAILVKEGGMTKDQARYSIASAAKVTTDLNYSHEARENALSLIDRMLKTIESLPTT